LAHKKNRRTIMTKEEQALELFIKATVLSRQRNECQERLELLNEEIQEALDEATDLLEGSIEKVVEAKKLKLKFGGAQ
jgi:chaperonin cofactor prefoldin